MNAINFSAETAPYISAGLPGLGGTLKLEPSHFIVEEIPLYEASGEGSHLYLTLRRAGFTTRQVMDDLARLFGVPAKDMGYAGLKDKQALTTQTFSLPSLLSEDEARRKAQNGPWEILNVSRHRNKLKTGHLLGNRFILILSEPQGKIDEARQIAKTLKTSGIPNYFGEQRFGRDGNNLERGLKLLRSGRKAKSWQDKFLLSSLQSFIYNIYLGMRIEDGLFQTVLTGDICKKTATGGLFQSEDGLVETARLTEGELSHTGPLFGREMKRTAGQAAELENKALAETGLTEAEIAGAGTGDRRANRLLTPDLTVEEAPTGLLFTFSLPKGAYATSVMREFIKTSHLNDAAEGCQEDMETRASDD